MTGLTGLSGLSAQEARTRAVAAAQALLHQPAAAGPADAWQVVGTLDQLAAELRTACMEGAAGAAGAADAGSAGAARPGSARPAGTGSAGAAAAGTAATSHLAYAAPWLEPAAELVTRLEEATAYWTDQSRFPWSNWDESANTELGMLLCELDALAATLLTAATDPTVHIHPDDDAFTAPDLFASSAAAAADAYVAAHALVAPTTCAASSAFLAAESPAHHTSPLDEPHAPPHRRPQARLLPSLSFAAAVIGVIGGVSVTATHTATAAVPGRAIASEPVPFTLHDGGSSNIGSNGGSGSGIAAQSQAAAPVSLSPNTPPASSAAFAPPGISAASSGAPAKSSTHLSAVDAALGLATDIGTGTGIDASANTSPPPSPVGPVRRPSPRHAAPRPELRDAPPPIQAAGPSQAQIVSFLTNLRRSAEQQDEQRLRALNQPMQNGMPNDLPAGFTPWG